MNAPTLTRVSGSQDSYPASADSTRRPGRPPRPERFVFGRGAPVAQHAAAAPAPREPALLLRRSPVANVLSALMNRLTSRSRLLRPAVHPPHLTNRPASGPPSGRPSLVCHRRWGVTPGGCQAFVGRGGGTAGHAGALDLRSGTQGLLTTPAPEIFPSGAAQSVDRTAPKGTTHTSAASA